MKNLKIGLLLHFYQPWWQFPTVLQKISDQCYRPILELVKRNDSFYFTANINLSLWELLKENGFFDIIDGFREASEKGKIELMGSPAQHPIMPLIPEFLQKAQIDEDISQKEKVFSIKRNSKGFYFPEMAFSRNNLRFVKNYDYGWTVLDDVLFKTVHNYVPFDHIITWEGLRTYMRSGYWSNRISSCRYSFQDINSMMNYEIPDWTGGHPAYIIIAFDAETIGHHCGCLVDNFLAPMFKEWPDRVVRIGSLDQSFPTKSVPYLPDGSWATTADDIRRNNPYPLWNSHINTYHSALWELVKMALDYFENRRQDCLQITSSCHWWWISKDHWEPEFMKKGAEKAVEIVIEFGDPAEKEKARRLYEKLKELK